MADTGRLYFWIGEQDAQGKDFSKPWTIPGSHLEAERPRCEATAATIDDIFQ